MRVLLAVSGGIDSMYLLYRASELIPGACFGVAHCNFNLRGAESDGDEVFVRGEAQSLGYEFHSTSFDTTEYAGSNGISIEMAARDLRYGWFAELCMEKGYDAVAVAHNADDNSETLLLNLIRGCGSKGLCGMQRESVRNGLRILRPMLGIERAGILEWMESEGRLWREDSTNAGDGHKRNILRHKVIPVLKELNPSLSGTLAANMGHWKELDEIAGRYFRESVTALNATDNRMPAKELIGLENWKYILWRWLEYCNFSAGTFDALCRLLESGRTLGGKSFHSPTHTLEISTDELTLYPGDGTVDRISPEVIPGPGTYRFGGRILEVRLLPSKCIASVKAPCGTVYFDSAKAPFPLTLRSWKYGDRLSPIGMKGSKKLSDIYGEAGLSNTAKKSGIVVEHSGRVICAFPMRTDKSVRIDPDTSEIISITEL